MRMAQAPFRGINGRLARRSIRVLISPTPSTFAERRSILQVLKQYGKIDVFKREDQRANRYISLTSTNETARTLTSVSPIACRVSLPRTDQNIRARQLQGLAPPATAPSIAVKARDEAQHQPLTSATPETLRKQELQEHDAEFETREFQLTIVPAHNYDHSLAATKGVEYPPWPAGYEADKSFAALALKSTLPDTLLKKGLSHWHVKPAADSARDSKAQRLARKQLMPGQMAESRSKEYK